MWDNDVMPIEIRPGLTVQIKGIPWDLTPAEADKLANVILALAIRATPVSEREEG